KYVQVLERIVADFPASSRYGIGLGLLLSQRGEFRRAIEVYAGLLKTDEKNALARNNLAWLLATCADPNLRDPARAVELAMKAVELAPEEGTYWNTLGVAHYRAGDVKAASDALHKSMGLRKGGDGFDWFFLAMAQWRLEHREEARAWYDKAV